MDCRKHDAGRRGTTAGGAKPHGCEIPAKVAHRSPASGAIRGSCYIDLPFRNLDDPAQLPSAAPADVFLLDTIGELAACYEFADIVFIGGTLSDHGGHNPIEPAYFGRPIIVGPHYSNFRSIFEEFRSNNAVLITENLNEALLSLLQNAQMRETMGAAAKKLLSMHAGATEVAMQTLRLYLGSFGKA